MLHTIEILQADFEYFFRDNIVEHLKEAEGDMELAEETITDAWAERASGGRFSHREIQEALG